MAANRAWSRLEVEATVADYFDMLEAELRGEPYVKAEHRRRLKTLLDDRSDSAIERKHQNISAVLIELGFPCIDGDKPLSNYQPRACYDTSPFWKSTLTHFRCRMRVPRRFATSPNHPPAPF